jgi:ADP-heptose:LPS heptosyltransferase
MPAEARGRSALVHLASGIGNIVMSTPMLIGLCDLGFAVDVRLDADYGETAGLFADWHVVRALVRDPDASRYDAIIAAIPPFYWPRFSAAYRSVARLVQRPPDSVFYRDEQEYYFAFARALGSAATGRPAYRLPIAPSERFGVTARTVVLAPGCKTGEMAAKRWPYFPQLAERFDVVAVVGTPDDLARADGSPMIFPSRVQSFVGTLSLRETAELMAAAGVVVANDSGLGHLAAAVGTPTLLLFGPTPHMVLGRFPPHVKVLRMGLPCEPCWFGEKLKACDARVDCLAALSPDRVERAVARLFEPVGEDR